MNLVSSDDEAQPVSRKRRLAKREVSVSEELKIKEDDSQSPMGKRRRMNKVVQESSDSENEKVCPSRHGQRAKFIEDKSAMKSSEGKGLSAPKVRALFAQFPPNRPYDSIRELRVERIFGCRDVKNSPRADTQAVADAVYLVKWEERSYRELCWVKYSDLIAFHDAEAKIAKFHRKNEGVYLSNFDEAIATENSTGLVKSRPFLESGGWRVPRVSVSVPHSEQGNFLLFCMMDRIIGFRVKKRRFGTVLRSFKEYLVKWNLLGYDAATWESELVLCGKGSYRHLYGLNRDESLSGSYEHYFDDAHLESLGKIEEQAISRYERSNRISKSLLATLKLESETPHPIHKLDGFEYNTSATTDGQGSTVLWQSFLRDKLGSGGCYKPSMDENGQCRSLLAHQQEGLKWLFYNVEKTSHGSLLADEMGLGKTCQSVVFLHHILECVSRKSQFAHALVVLQKSTIENWKREFALWAPSLNVVAFSGSKSDRTAVVEWEVKFHNMRDGSDRKDVTNPLRADVILATYESVRSREFKLLLPAKHRWTAVVVDECQKAKGGYASVLRGALERIPRDNIVLLSGTPVQNSVKELFPLLSLLDPKKFSYEVPSPRGVEYSEETFLEEFGDIQNRDDCVALTERLQELLRPYILRREKDLVLKSLPPKLVKLVKVPLTMIQKKVYQAVYHRTAKLRVSGLQMQLRKVCIHPFMVDSIETLIMEGKFGPLKFRSNEAVAKGNDKTPNSESTSASSTSSVEGSQRTTNGSKKEPEDANREIEVLLQCSGKFVLIDKMLRAYKDRGQKVLMFSFFKTALDLVQYYAELRHWVTERLDGDTTGEARQICIDRFNADPSRFLFLCTTRAGGLGVNLTAASVVIHLDSDYNPQHDLQAQARCHRIGQNRNVEVYHLVAEDTYENHILFEVAGRKLGLEQVLLGRLQAATQHCKHKLNKQQEEVALKKGVYAALRDDARTAEEEEAFANLSIESILAQKTEVIAEGNNKEGSALPSAFSTARFDENDVELYRSDFWDEVQDKLSRLNADAGDFLGDGHSSTDILPEPGTRHVRRARAGVHHAATGPGGLAPTDTSVSTGEGADSESVIEDGESPFSESDAEDDVDFEIGHERHGSQTQDPSNQSPSKASTAFAISTPPPAATSTKPGPTKKATRVSCKKPAGEDGMNVIDAETGCRVSVVRKRRSRPLQAAEGCVSATSNRVVAPVDLNALRQAIQISVDVTQPSISAAERVCEALSAQGLEKLADLWKECNANKQSSSPLSAAVNVPPQARAFELTYRCLKGIETWTKTAFGTANGIKSDHLRWIDQFSTWGILSLPETTLKVLEDSCGFQEVIKRQDYGVGAAALTFLKEFLGAVTSWLASCAAWEAGRQQFPDIMISAYEKKKIEVPSLGDGDKQWFEHGIFTEELVAAVLKPLAAEVFGEKIGNREGASRRQTWIPAEDLVAKFVFLHLAIGCDLQAKLTWPPPGSEVDWALVSQVVGRVSKLADGPERRRDAVLNRYYNRLDCRWNEEPFTSEEKDHLAAGFHSKSQPIIIAKLLDRRNLEKVKKGLRCIQLQLNAGEKKRKFEPTSPSAPETETAAAAPTLATLNTHQLVRTMITVEDDDDDDTLGLINQMTAAKGLEPGADLMDVWKPKDWVAAGVVISRPVDDVD
eukprot:Gregarina_sp_Poly_1__11251@NODE_92_length_14764_cov_231_259032_g79_i0_p1_GENE_NODE_92_length_14764_cov_231_259032_g79_i0NODE_92_length_14764_cov_231_259032_g79_i0_p1_ORF_typecomplete_len1654_score289_39SNF2_N/PF00176_23/7_6e53Helicase_C/PF00271_31/6_5e16Chromo/PF00385_24/0_00049Chromo/PF00385_24/7_5e07Chromo/PF00385_24/2_9e03ResIII/PF04851_15/6_4e11ERCC3_RAD25_C/PF16203_5/4_5e09HDA23/PF11496_8/5_5e05Myb_DNAbind_6/PF13921_6/1_1e04Myb_DNAbind_6/PF13921_6/0_0081DEAD/PF00270_29/0_011_NODE_92_length_